MTDGGPVRSTSRSKNVVAKHRQSTRFYGPWIQGTPELEQAFLLWSTHQLSTSLSASSPFGHIPSTLIRGILTYHPKSRYTLVPNSIHTTANDLGYSYPPIWAHIATWKMFRISWVFLPSFSNWCTQSNWSDPRAPSPQRFGHLVK